MGLSNRGGNKNYVKIMGLKEKEPHFELKKGEEIESYTSISGMFGGISFKTIEWNKDGQKGSRRVFDLILIDEDEYIVQSGFTSIGRSILNSLANGDLGEVEISLYVNKKGYPSVYITNNGQPLAWKLNWEEQQELTDVTELPNGDKVYTRDKLDAKLEENALKLNGKTENKVEEEAEDLQF